MTWPNWVDLIVIIIVFRTCYVAFSRGVWTEFLNLLGLVAVTVLVVNYSNLVIQAALPWIGWANPTTITFILFWALFAGSVVAMHVLLRLLTKVLKWERLHWFIQMIAVACGALRGLWWAGLVLLTLAGSGVPYFTASVEERSLSGPFLVDKARSVLEEVSNRFPGAENRMDPPLPPCR